jgi:hypothetical protein
MEAESDIYHVLHHIDKLILVLIGGTDCGKSAITLRYVKN